MLPHPLEVQAPERRKTGHRCPWYRQGPWVHRPCPPAACVAGPGPRHLHHHEMREELPVRCGAVQQRAAGARALELDAGYTAPAHGMPHTSSPLHKLGGCVWSATGAVPHHSTGAELLTLPEVILPSCRPLRGRKHNVLPPSLLRRPGGGLLNRLVPWRWLQGVIQVTAGAHPRRTDMSRALRLIRASPHKSARRPDSTPPPLSRSSGGGVHASAHV